MRNKLDLRYNSAVSRSVQSTYSPYPSFYLHVMSLISTLLSPATATVRVMTMCTQTSEGNSPERSVVYRCA